MDRDRYAELLARDGTRAKDVERKALFWILSVEDLYAKVNYIYDFENRGIKLDCLDNKDVDFCSSSRALITLGFNLFNGFPADVISSFSNLDESNFNLALEAIKIRFEK